MPAYTALLTATQRLVVHAWIQQYCPVSTIATFGGAYVLQTSLCKPPAATSVNAAQAARTSKC